MQIIYLLTIGLFYSVLIYSKNTLIHFILLIIFDGTACFNNSHLPFPIQKNKSSKCSEQIKLVFDIFSGSTPFSCKKLNHLFLMGSLRGNLKYIVNVFFIIYHQIKLKIKTLFHKNNIHMKSYISQFSFSIVRFSTNYTTRHF